MSTKICFVKVNNPFKGQKGLPNVYTIALKSKPPKSRSKTPDIWDKYPPFGKQVKPFNSQHTPNTVPPTFQILHLMQLC